MATIRTNLYEDIKNFPLAKSEKGKNTSGLEAFKVDHVDINTRTCFQDRCIPMYFDMVERKEPLAILKKEKPA